MPEADERSDEEPAPVPSYPVTDYDDAARELRRPPPAPALRFQMAETTPDKKVALVLSGTEGTRVRNLLDHVCGGRWSPQLLPVPDSARRPRGKGQSQVALLCRLQVFDVVRDGIGEGADSKNAATEALKRAAYEFGVNRALYEWPARWLRVGDRDGELRVDEHGDPFIDARTERYLRERYRRWLRTKAGRRFGVPLDLGDRPPPTGTRRPQLAAVPRQQATPGGPNAGDRPAAAQTARPPAGGRAQPRTDQAAKPATARGAAPAGERVAQWLRDCGYSPETADLLAALLYRLGSASDLDAEQAADLCQLLGQARVGGVGDEALGKSLRRLTTYEGAEREDGIARLRERLAVKQREAEATRAQAA